MKRFIRAFVIAAVLALVLLNVMIIFGRTFIDLYNRKAIGVSIVPEESCFIDFFHAGENTYYKCRVTLKNDTDESKQITLHGLLPIDCFLGYIRDPVLMATQEDGEKLTLILEPHSTHGYVLFFQTGRGWIDKKFDRRLPWIVCIENESSRK